MPAGGGKDASPWICASLDAGSGGWCAPGRRACWRDLQTRAATRIAVAARTGSFKTRLPAGKYQFVAQAEGFESTTLDVAVEPGSEQEIALRMKKAR
jgi:hypothetical protein